MNNFEVKDIEKMLTYIERREKHCRLELFEALEKTVSLMWFSGAFNFKEEDKYDCVIDMLDEFYKIHIQHKI